MKVKNMVIILTVKTSKTVNFEVKPTKINKSKAVEILEGTKGKFVTVTFNKKNGAPRTMNCIFKATTNKLGYIQVRETKSQDIKNIAAMNITALKAGGNSYRVG